MGLTGLSQLPPSLRSRLTDDGEEPLAWERVALWGASRSGRPRAIEGFELNPLRALAGGPIRLDDDLFERWLQGVSLTGSAGSAAARLGRVLEPLADARLAVTTRRLVLLKEGTRTFGEDPATGRRTWDVDTTELWSVPRGAVRGATRRSRLFMAGRLVVGFEDSSSVALMCGMVSPRAAHRLRGALLAPHAGTPIRPVHPEARGPVDG